LSKKSLATLLLACSVGGAIQQGGVRYTDIAAEVGLTVVNTYGEISRKYYILETTGNGAAIFDYDNDGWNDIFITNGARIGAAGKAPPPQLYRNQGGGKFKDVATEAGLVKGGWGQAACAGDFDNDGHTDLFVTYYGHNVLYRNQNARFVDVTAQARLPVVGTRWGAGCAFLDYDRDGFLDIFVSNYVDLDLKSTPKPGDSDNCRWKGLAVMCGPTGLPKAQNALYRNLRDGTFEDVSESSQILKPGGRYGLGVIAADFDNDGWTDIYVACDMTPSLLYRNRGDGTFEERGVEAGVAYNFDGRLQAGMGVAVADLDGNGFLDIAKTNFSGDLPSLYLNEDGRFFTDESLRAGLAKHQLLGWGVLFVDADEDGWPDLMMANGHVYPEVDQAEVGDKYLQRTLFYRNSGSARFIDLTDQAGPALQTLRPARGMAAGDLDGDGHPEIVIVNMNERPSLLKNTAPRANALLVRLRGTRSNRNAIGARVTLEAGGRTQMQDVVSGGSYYSQSDLALHFGLGAALVVDRLVVRWPSGHTQSWTAIPANQALTIIEDSPILQTRPFQGR
jgi:hypothetical protein